MTSRVDVGAEVAEVEATVGELRGHGALGLFGAEGDVPINGVVDLLDDVVGEGLFVGGDCVLDGGQADIGGGQGEAEVAEVIEPCLAGGVGGEIEDALLLGFEGRFDLVTLALQLVVAREGASTQQRKRGKSGDGDEANVHTASVPGLRSARPRRTEAALGLFGWRAIGAGTV